MLSITSPLIFMTVFPFVFLNKLIDGKIIKAERNKFISYAFLIPIPPKNKGVIIIVIYGLND